MSVGLRGEESGVGGQLQEAGEQEGVGEAGGRGWGFREPWGAISGQQRPDGLRLWSDKLPGEGRLQR